LLSANLPAVAAPAINGGALSRRLALEGTVHNSLTTAAPLLPGSAPTANITAIGRNALSQQSRRRQAMTWTTPEVTEVCVGMEVTSYESAEI
jgi:coenzyme PQQ precursor peptide PqqA